MPQIVRNIFEDYVKERFDLQDCIAVNNGTTALHLALIASGVKEGDEVLVPDITFISTGNVVIYENAKPVIVECDPKTYNISLEDAEKKITKNTKAIIPVDMNGLPVDYDEILAFSKKHNLQVIADSAEALGAVYKEKKIGALAPIHIFSFFPNKNITTGEGGMITTNNKSYADRIKKLRNQGQEYRYHHTMLGYNYRMTDILASIGIEQLKRIRNTITEKEKIAKRYTEEFKNDDLIFSPFVPDYVDQHSWYMYAISLDKSIDRDYVVAELKKRGIETRLSFPPMHTQPYYQEKFEYNDDSFPISMGAWEQLINIPIWVGIGIEKQKYVIDCLRNIIVKVES